MITTVAIWRLVHKIENLSSRNSRGQLKKGKLIASLTMRNYSPRLSFTAISMSCSDPR
jgi:hypothetical protein